MSFLKPIQASFRQISAVLTKPAVRTAGLVALLLSLYACAGSVAGSVNVPPPVAQTPQGTTQQLKPLQTRLGPNGELLKCYQIQGGQCTLMRQYSGSEENIARFQRGEKNFIRGSSMIETRLVVAPDGTQHWEQRRFAVKNPVDTLRAGLNGLADGIGTAIGVAELPGKVIDAAAQEGIKETYRQEDKLHQAGIETGSGGGSLYGVISVGQGSKGTVQVEGHAYAAPALPDPPPALGTGFWIEP